MLIEQRVNDDLAIVDDCMSYAMKCGLAGQWYQAGAAASAARDGCEAIATRIELLADALDRSEYHNARLQWLRQIAQKTRHLQAGLVTAVSGFEAKVRAT